MPERAPSSGLDRLLDLRRHEEERRIAELVRARQALDQADETVRSLVSRRQELEESLVAPEPSSIGRVQSLRMVLERVDAGIHNARSVRQAAVHEADERTAELLDAARDREALERVVRSRQEHARQLKRASEQKQEDEVALVQFRLKSREAQ